MLDFSDMVTLWVLTGIILMVAETSDPRRYCYFSRWCLFDRRRLHSTRIHQRLDLSHDPVVY